MTHIVWLLAASLAMLAAGATSAIHPRPRLLWNASASVATGLYALGPAGELHEAELVVVDPPPALARFADERGYLPQREPMLKRVAALPGQTVCRTGDVITIDGIARGEALTADRQGRPLPVWQGCQRLSAGTVFLMNGRSAHSFDGRYFGLLPASTIVARAVPLWTREDP